MRDLERDLKSALRREVPPVDFAARFQQQRRAQKKRRWTWSFAAAAAAVLMMFSFAQYRSWQEEKAGREALVALRITAEKLNHARANVLRVVSDTETGNNQ